VISAQLFVDTSVEDARARPAPPWPFTSELRALGSRRL